jgi:tetratricopeptide (TPR) repeat protein
LRLADYESFGGIEGAIEKAVERAFARADADPRIPRDRKSREALLRRGLIPWLAGIDPDTKSPRRNIARRADIPEEARPLIDLLVEERLLSTDVAKDTGEATIEPAHEALLRQWGLLKGWLAEDFGRLATLEGVERGARDWDANARSPAWLAHQGQRLAEARALDERPDIAARLDALDRRYLAQCQAKEEEARAQEETRRREREQEQTRRLADAEALAAANKRTTQRTRIGLFAALMLAVAAVWQWQAATAQKQFAETQRDRAERALTTATKTADALVFDLAQKFRNVVGIPAETIADILERARKLQEDLLSAGETNPVLLRSQAAALDERARSLLDIGDTSGALAAAQKSVAICRKLAEDKSNAEAQRDLSVSLQRIGDVKLRAGDAAGALAAYEESLGIVRDLAKDKTNAEAQRDLSVSLGNIGDLKLQANDAAGALAAYEESLAIRRDLAKDKTNTGAQRDLSISDEKVADALEKLGKLEDALAYDEDDLAISERLAKLDDSGEAAHRDLAIALQRVGTDLRKLGQLDEAFVDYDRALAIRRRLADAHPERSDLRDDVGEAAERMGGLAFNLLLARKFEKSLDASDRAIAAEPGLVWLVTNRAHALMFLGRVDEARALYRAHRGEKTQDDKIWEDDIREDFAELRKAGLTNPLMDEIERTFAKKH